MVGLLGNALGGLVGRERDRDDAENEPREQQQQINNNSHVFHFDGKQHNVVVFMNFVLNFIFVGSRQVLCKR